MPGLELLSWQFEQYSEDAVSEPFLGQIKMFGGNFAPRGWALCDGQLLSINANQSLFSILGTTYGGDGRTTFGLPELRGRAAVHPGANGVTLGERIGAEMVTLDQNQIPGHTHRPRGTSNPGSTGDPADKAFATKVIFTSSYYGDPANGTAPMHDDVIGNTGGGQGHENMQPFIVINFIIALQGIFPSRN